MNKTLDWASIKKWQLLDKLDKKRGIYFATDEFIHRFAYFGELGYGIMSFFPFLNFIASIKKIEIETYGPIGSSAFFYFSNKHTELPINTVPGLGNRDTAIQVAKMNGKKAFFSPRTMTPSYFLQSDDSMCWRGLDGGRIQPHHGGYLNLDYNFKILLSPTIEKWLQKEYILVNIKNHYNWNNISIPNFYNYDDIFKLSKLAMKRGQYVYLNDVQIPIEDSEIGFKNDLKEKCGSLRNILFLSDFYANEKSQAERTKIQLRFMQKAKHVYASQGGNAALSIINNRNVTVLMRGGFDWPDYVDLSRKYSTKTEYVYDIQQSNSFLNSNH